MFRNILAIVTGLLTAFVIIIITEGFGHAIYPAPAGLDMNNMDAIREYTQHAPTIVFVLVILAYALGSIVGGLIASVIAVHKKMTKSITVGGILMGLGAYNLFMIPHPIWTIVISIFIFIPCSYLGGYLGIRISAKRRRNSVES